MRRLDLDEMARWTGLVRGTVRYLAMGVTSPNANTLAKIATVLEVPIQSFFVANDKESPRRSQP